MVAGRSPPGDRKEGRFVGNRLYDSLRVMGRDDEGRKGDGIIDGDGTDGIEETSSNLGNDSVFVMIGVGATELGATPLSLASSYG